MRTCRRWWVLGGCLVGAWWVLRRIWAEANGGSVSGRDFGRWTGTRERARKSRPGTASAANHAAAGWRPLGDSSDGCGRAGAAGDEQRVARGGCWRWEADRRRAGNWQETGRRRGRRREEGHRRWRAMVGVERAVG